MNWNEFMFGKRNKKDQYYEEKYEDKYEDEYEESEE